MNAQTHDELVLKQIAPDGIPYALDKAERYRLLNDPEQAESICRDILAVDPDHQDTLRTLVLALSDQFGGGAAHAGARTALEKALTTSKDAAVIEHYGDVLWQLNDHDKALAEWQRARKAGPGSEFLDRKIKERKLIEN